MHLAMQILHFVIANLERLHIFGLVFNVRLDLIDFADEIAVQQRFARLQIVDPGQVVLNDRVVKFVDLIVVGVQNAVRVRKHLVDASKHLRFVRQLLQIAFDVE